MPHPPVPPIAGLGIDTIQMTHALRQISVRRLNQQVVVIIHQALGITYPVELGYDLLQRRQKHLPVLVILINVFTPITTRGDVIESVREFDADWAGHNGENITWGMLLI